MYIRIYIYTHFHISIYIPIIYTHTFSIEQSSRHRAASLDVNLPWAAVYSSFFSLLVLPSTSSFQMTNDEKGKCQYTHISSNIFPDLPSNNRNHWPSKVVYFIKSTTRGANILPSLEFLEPGVFDFYQDPQNQEAAQLGFEE